MQTYLSSTCSRFSALSLAAHLSDSVDCICSLAFANSLLVWAKASCKLAHFCSSFSLSALWWKQNVLFYQFEHTVPWTKFRVLSWDQTNKYANSALIVGVAGWVSCQTHFSTGVWSSVFNQLICISWPSYNWLAVPPLTTYWYTNLINQAKPSSSSDRIMS